MPRPGPGPSSKAMKLAQAVREVSHRPERERSKCQVCKLESAPLLDRLFLAGVPCSTLYHLAGIPHAAFQAHLHAHQLYRKRRKLIREHPDLFLQAIYDQVDWEQVDPATKAIAATRAAERIAVVAGAVSERVEVHHPFLELLLQIHRERQGRQGPAAALPPGPGGEEPGEATKLT